MSDSVMSSNEIMARERHFWEEWNKGKEVFLAEIDEICDNNVIFHGWFDNEYGLKDFKQYARELFITFPDLSWVIQDIIVDGDKVAIRYIMTGTFKREFRGNSSNQ